MYFKETILKWLKFLFVYFFYFLSSSFLIINNKLDKKLSLKYFSYMFVLILKMDYIIILLDIFIIFSCFIKGIGPVISLYK